MDRPEPADRPEQLTVDEVATETRRSHDAVLRWMTVGVVIAVGRVKLAGRRVGGRWQITRDALDRFLADCNPVAPPPRPNPAVTAARYKRDKAAAARVLNGGAV